MQPFMDWNDLPYFLAVAEGGNLSRAASRLGVNHSTVFRRINAMEQRLRVRLFERLSEGYVLTEAGRQALDFARQAEESVDALERVVAGRDVALIGQIRMTTAPDLARLYVAPCLSRFAEIHPAIRVEVAVADSDYDLGRREADLALRATTAPPEHLVGRRVGDLIWRAWASPAYLQREGRPDAMGSLKSHRLIGSDAGFLRLAVFSSVHRRYPPESFAATAGDLSTMGAMAAEGIGVAFLPHDPTGGRLEPLFPLDPPHHSTLWILTHPDLRNVARIRVFTEFLHSHLRSAVGDGPGAGRAQTGRQHA